MIFITPLILTVHPSGNSETTGHREPKASPQPVYTQFASSLKTATAKSLPSQPIASSNGAAGKPAFVTMPIPSPSSSACTSGQPVCDAASAADFNQPLPSPSLPSLPSLPPSLPSLPSLPSPPPSPSIPPRLPFHSCCSWRHGRVSSRTMLPVVGLLVVAIELAIALAVCLWYRSHNDTSAPLGGPRVDLGYAVYAGSRLEVAVPDALSAPAAAANTSSNDSPVVALHRFLGMRYAAPPIGNLRWQAPQPPPPFATPLATVQPATTFGSICLGMSAVPGKASREDEDCLFVNVWAPANATPGTLPVWVFIQGGGYTANANADWDGADVVARSGGRLVFVSFNYRVGLWGFLAGPALAATNGDGGGVLNAGLLDQRFLLAWVQQHISTFGGDPHHVVIHGASAGAGSVLLHTVANGGRDDHLFVGAVAQSPFMPTQPTAASLAWQFDRVAAAAGCLAASDAPADAPAVARALACLRAASATTLQQTANVASPWPGRTGSPLFYWGPCVDGSLLPDRPSALIAAGRVLFVPMLYGHDTNEGTGFVANAGTAADAAAFLIDNYPGLAATATAATTTKLPTAAHERTLFRAAKTAKTAVATITTTASSLPSFFSSSSANSTLADALLAAHYQPAVMPALPRHAAWFAALAGAYGDATFVCAATRFMDGQAKAAAKAAATEPRIYSYRFNMQDPGILASGLGVPHMLEAGAVFGPANIGGGAPASLHSTNAGLVSVMMDYFIAFVQHLDPNTAFRNRATVAWAPWVSPAANGTNASNASIASIATARQHRLLIQAADNLTMETVLDDEFARCRAWDALAGAMQQ